MQPGGTFFFAAFRQGLFCLLLPG
ncbi:protein of unknown function [Cupriavidus taiwanensis]|uniref:Uncharacterized protein n=1 Tax=Cupriavidus taiwanensis TaxID=164546 RepID=A0A9Q7XUM4_9BURK|nr:protein of unknown function [Cupriavidus taiwanensis]